MCVCIVYIYIHMCIEYPLAMMTLLLKMVIDWNSGFSNENGDCPVRYVTNYQRVTTLVNGCASTIIHRTIIEPWFHTYLIHLMSPLPFRG